MKAIILDSRSEGDSSCYLTKIVLRDFVNSLSEEYRDYEIQREIVSNTYLDNLIDTVLNKKHIPSIVLVVDAPHFSIQKMELEISKFKILDGLQRTFRLKLIWESIKFFKREVKKSENILKLKRLELSRKYSEQLEEINSNSRILESIIKYYNEKILNEINFNIEECFNNNQWFEIWTNLTPKDEVNKMLILNAGHKPVKTQHQLELLFLHLIPIIKKTDLETFELIREKESNSTLFSKRRKKGQFHFSHLITSLLSLNEGKPITANVNLIQKTQSSDYETESFYEYFNYDFLHKFIEVLLKLDDSIYKEYQEIGLKWMGREVSLVGMFAALGKYGKEKHILALPLLNEFEEKIINRASILRLEDFEDNRNKLNLSKINIGTVNKNAIYDGIYSTLINNESEISWSNFF